MGSLLTEWRLEPSSGLIAEHGQGGVKRGKKRTEVRDEARAEMPKFNTITETRDFIVKITRAFCL